MGIIHPRRGEQPMYNPDFWEILVDPADLDRFPNEAGIWFESREERKARYRREDLFRDLTTRLMRVIAEALTEQQREVVVLYFLYGKTQHEIAQIMGISRRVVSQHLFGIVRNGKQVGGALKKIRKLCKERGIGIQK
jgi:RNA polymerase sigma factor (sigma-70 family)